MKRTDSTEGFTLLELVIALSITSLILVFIGSAFYMGYRSEERASEREGLQQRIRIINERLTWLLRCTYPFVRVSPEGNTLYFFGKKDSIGFVTTSTLSGSALEERAGLTFMKIFLDDGSLKVLERIFFQRDIFEGSGGRVYTLFDNIESMDFQYLDGNPETGADQWVSEWLPDEKDYLPAAVRIDLSIHYRGGVVDIPPIVVDIRTRRRLT